MMSHVHRGLLGACERKELRKLVLVYFKSKLKYIYDIRMYTMVKQSMPKYCFAVMRHQCTNTNACII